MSQAWHTAAFALSGFGGNLKPLETYTGKKRKPLSKVEHAQEQRALMHMIAETRGLRIRTKES